MRKYINKVLSLILVLSMVLSSNAPVFADESYASTQTSIISNTQADIVTARKIYAELSPEAKAIFDQSLVYDYNMLEFHKTYIDENFTLPVLVFSTRSYVNITDPMHVLTVQLKNLHLPSAVLYSLKAMGASMVAAVADGPLPVGDILLASATASTVAVIALNWDAVSPKFGEITKAFQTAFSGAASSISTAFSKIKGDAKKEADKNKTKNPTGNRVKDVQERLKKEGFKKTGQTGSHEKWKKEEKTVTVPNHGPKYEIPIGTLRNIWKQAGWI